MSNYPSPSSPSDHGPVNHFKMLSSLLSDRSLVLPMSVDLTARIRHLCPLLPLGVVLQLSLVNLTDKDQGTSIEECLQDVIE
ncbi:unnamed protein product [Umbelopsis ramanniana]